MTLQEKSKQLKYIKNNLEITLNLSKVIQSIYEDEILKNSIVLKGGAAVQIYLQDFKRLFFDLDIDFISNTLSREDFKNYLINHLINLGYNEPNQRKNRLSYSLDSFQLPYYLENKNLTYLILDINYSYNPHLYNPTQISICNKDFNLEQIVSLVNLEELIGLKIAALKDRGRPKDLFDIYQILNSNLSFDLERIKAVYIYYMTIANNEDKIEKIDKITEITNYNIKKNLYPIIKKNSNPNLEKMKKEVLDYIMECSILTKEQEQFITNFKKGYNNPEYLFKDEQVIENAINNPIAKWKIKLIRRK